MRSLVADYADASGQDRRSMVSALLALRFIGRRYSARRIVFLNIVAAIVILRLWLSGRAVYDRRAGLRAVAPVIPVKQWAKGLCFRHETVFFQASCAAQYTARPSPGPDSPSAEAIDNLVRRP
jgi:hypothetical protein